MNPVTLALIRIATGALLATTADLHGAVRWGDLDPGLRTVPWGLGWFVDLVPISSTYAHWARVLTVFAASMGALGVMSRLAFGVAGLAGAYVLAIGQFAGSVVHNHHILWLCALLAASPCGDALSVDAWFGHRTSEGTSRRYATPVYAAWALVACVYGFPGLWKLIHAGVAWAEPDTLRNLMHWKWMQTGQVPWPRIDEVPWLLSAAAVSVLVLEVGMPLWVSLRRTRHWVLLGLVVFHVGTARFLFIRFETLFALAVCLVDGDRLASALWRWVPRLRPVFERLALVTPLTTERARDSFRPTSRLVPAVVVGGALVSGALGAVQAWPFACYPTFDDPVAETMPSLRVEVVDRSGMTTRLPPPRSNNEWALAWRLAGAYGSPAEPAALRTYARRILRRAGNVRYAQEASHLRVVSERVVFDAEAPHRQRPVTRRVLLEIRLVDGPHASGTGEDVEAGRREGSGAEVRRGVDPVPREGP